MDEIGRGGGGYTLVRLGQAEKREVEREGRSSIKGERERGRVKGKKGMDKVRGGRRDR